MLRCFTLLKTAILCEVICMKKPWFCSDFDIQEFCLPMLTCRFHELFLSQFGVILGNEVNVKESP